VNGDSYYGGGVGGVSPQCGFAAGQRPGAECKALNPAHVRMPAPTKSAITANPISPFHMRPICRGTFSIICRLIVRWDYPRQPVPPNVAGAHYEAQFALCRVQFPWQQTLASPSALICSGKPDSPQLLSFSLKKNVRFRSLSDYVSTIIQSPRPMSASATRAKRLPKCRSVELPVVLDRSSRMTISSKVWSIQQWFESLPKIA
jgi:hypothetical protein